MGKSLAAALIACGIWLIASPGRASSDPRTDDVTKWTTQEWPQGGQAGFSTKLTTAPFNRGPYPADNKSPPTWLYSYPWDTETSGVAPLVTEYLPGLNTAPHGPYGILFVYNNHHEDISGHRYVLMLCDPKTGDPLGATVGGRFVPCVIPLACAIRGSPAIIPDGDTGGTAVVAYESCEKLAAHRFVVTHTTVWVQIPGGGSIQVDSYSSASYYAEFKLADKETCAFGPAVQRTIAYVPGDLTETKKLAGLLHALDWTTMSEIWKAPLQTGEGLDRPLPKGQKPPEAKDIYQPTTQAVARDNLVVIGAVKMKPGKLEDEAWPTESMLFAFNATDGRQMWKYKADGKINPNPAITGDTVIFGTSKGRVHALTLLGKEVWKTTDAGRAQSCPAPFNTPAILTDVSLYGPAVDAHGQFAYFGGSDGRVHRFSVHGGGHLTSAPSGYYYGVSFDATIGWLRYETDRNGNILVKPFTINTPPAINDSSTDHFLVVRLSTQNRGTEDDPVPYNASLIKTYTLPDLTTFEDVTWASNGPYIMGNGSFFTTMPDPVAGAVCLSSSLLREYDIVLRQTIHFPDSSALTPRLGKDENDTGSVIISNGYIFANDSAGNVIGVPSNFLLSPPPIGMVGSPGPLNPYVPPPAVEPIRVYPNPFRPDKAAGGVLKFRGLPSGSRVELFTLAHERVRVLAPAGGVALWDGTNETGQKAATGVYLYIITLPEGPPVRGRVALIRKK